MTAVAMRSIGACTSAIALLWLPLPGACQEQRWAIASTPTVSIGGEASGPASDLAGVRGVVRLSNGGIVVADRAQRLLMFDGSGRYLRTVGRRGGGPGEFGSILWLQRLANDTILVSDAYNAGRLSYFGADGGFVRSINAGSIVQRVVGALDDGSLIGIKTRYGGAGARAAGQEVQWGRDSLELVRFDSNGRVLNSLGVFPGFEWITPPNLGLIVVSMDDASPLRATVVTVGHGRIYLTSGDRFEVRSLAPDGTPLGVIQEARAQVPLAQSQLAEFFRELTAGTSSGAQTPWESLRWNIPSGQTLPIITALRLDEVGNLWIGERRARRAAPQNWLVHEASGRRLATTTVPGGFQPFAMDNESVLGVWRDQLGIEYVQVRSMVRR